MADDEREELLALFGDLRVADVRDGMDWMSMHHYGSMDLRIREWYFGKKGGEYHARRSDLASGQSKIYLRADRDLLVGRAHDVRIKVTYRDGPATTWRLEYSGPRGLTATPAVTTANTDRWKTATSAVPELHFNGAFRDAMDFRISNEDCKDLTVRLVRVVKARPPSGS